MYGVAIRDNIRSWVLLQGKSQRSAAKQFGVSRDTVARMLREPGEESVRKYRRDRHRPAPVRDAALSFIQQWLEENEQLKPWAKKAAVDGPSHVGGAQTPGHHRGRVDGASAGPHAAAKGLCFVNKISPLSKSSATRETERNDAGHMPTRRSCFLFLGLGGGRSELARTNKDRGCPVLCWGYRFVYAGADSVTYAGAS